VVLKIEFRIFFFFCLVYIFAAMAFNYSALSCTKQLNSTTRVVYANIRIILVWLFAIIFYREKFNWLKLFGFIFLIFGTLIYNSFFSFDSCKKVPASKDEIDESEKAPLINSK
jgi:multidrug transporter EmrE-like cation transporter